MFFLQWRDDELRGSMLVTPFTSDPNETVGPYIVEFVTPNVGSGPALHFSMPGYNYHGFATIASVVLNARSVFEKVE